jgi:hypothetical protein
MTPRCKRFFFYVMQRSAVRFLISRVGVFNCKITTGTKPPKWSPHARGDAGDIFVDTSGNKSTEQIHAELERIAKNVIKQATRRTIANRGIKRPVVHVIWLQKEWIANEGIRTYNGVFHATHAHVGFSFSTTEKPPCAS